jgi:multiple sugar transport system substrate-binding protein
MPLTRNQIAILGAGALVVVFLILLFTGIIPGLREDVNTGNLPKVQLTFWGVFDDPSVFKNAISRYAQAHQNVRIEYRQMNEATYESDLLNALAAGNGPDILMIRNTWIPKHYNKITPVPATQLSFTDFQRSYPAVAIQDFTSQGAIYSIPLYIDTLALLYNRDFFDRKAVALPPTTWEGFEALIPRLREVNQNTGEIVKAAAAIGGSSKSVNRSFDLLSALFLQNDTQMTDAQFTSATFANPQGVQSLQYYLQFANPNSPLYTWNDTLHYSIDNFAEGDVAMIFNYAFQVSALKKKNPFLNVVAAPLPQSNPDSPVTAANYWGLAVSNKSQNIATAWDFILSLAYNTDSAREYRELSGHPPALRTLINESLNDSALGVFARQALIARSWPEIDDVAVEQSFSNMVDSALRGQSTPSAALQKAEDEVTQLMRRR